jgi:hypothetical protein
VVSLRKSYEQGAVLRFTVIQQTCWPDTMNHRSTESAVTALGRRGRENPVLKAAEHGGRLHHFATAIRFASNFLEVLGERTAWRAACARADGNHSRNRYARPFQCAVR